MKDDLAFHMPISAALISFGTMILNTTLMQNEF